MAVRARLTVRPIETLNWDGKEVERVRMDAVYSTDPNDPNSSYSVATPSAHLEMVVQNPSARGFFVPGKTYDVTFTETEV